MTVAQDATNRMPETGRSLGWCEASLWMGSSFPAWWRILSRGRFAVAPTRIPGALLDGAFAAGNSLVRLLQQLGHGRRIKAVELPGRPLFVIGHWRTGTTLMHELLALDSRWRTPNSFECFVPNHFVLSRRWLAPWSGFVLPRLRPPDQMVMGWNRPQEDEFALCLRGAGSLYDQIAFPRRLTERCPSLHLASLPASQREHWLATWLQFLRELIYVRPGRLLLKSPTHTFRIAQIREVFPDAQFVLMVRNPYDIFASTCKLWNSLFVPHGYQPWPDRRDPDQDRLAEFVLRIMEEMLDETDQVLGDIDERLLHVVRFEEFTQSPLETMQRIYERLELGGTDDVKPIWERELAHRSAHRADSYQLPSNRRAEIKRRWQRYFEQFEYVR